VRTALVVLAAGVDLFVFSARYNTTTSPSLLSRVPPALGFIQSEDPNGRVAALAETLLPNTGMLFHLHDFRVYEPVADHHLLPYFERLDDELLSDIRSRFYLFLWKPRVPLLSVAGVRWVLAPEQDERTASAAALAEAGLVRRFSAEGTEVWENPAARPRAYVTNDTVGVRTADAALDWLVDNARDSAATVVVRDGTMGIGGPPFPETPGAGLPASMGAVRKASFVPGRVQIAVSGGSGYLVVNDLYYPGWVATFDGQPDVAIHRANYLFMSVFIPDDEEHEIVLEYRPPAVAMGGMLSFASLALVGLVFALAELRMRLPIGWARRASGEPNPIG
jgi:hypothetical protein